MKSIQFYFSLIIFFMMACARPGEIPVVAPPPSGDSPSNAPKSGDQNSKEKEDLLTNISLKLFDSQLPASRSCDEQNSDSEIVNVTDKIKFDGELDDWANASAFIEDLQQDVKEGIDFDKIYLGTTQDAVYLGINTNVVNFDSVEQAAEDIYIEFGGLKYHEGKVRHEALRLFKITTAQQVFDYQNGNWLSLIQERGSVHIKQKSIEIKFSLREIEGVFYQPAWWLRVYSKKDQQLKDSTTARYTTSLLAAAKKDFGLNNCFIKRNKDQYFVLQEIYSQTIEQKTIKEMFELAQSAQEGIRFVLGEDWSLAKGAAIILVEKPSLDTPSLIEQDFEDVKNYFAIELSISQLSSENVNPYGRQDLYVYLASELLQRALVAINPDSPLYFYDLLKYITIDRLLVNNLGYSYWFYYYYLTTKEFHNHLDVERPIAIDKLYNEFMATDRANQELRNQKYNQFHSKLVAFGHIVANYFELKDLMATFQVLKFQLFEHSFEQSFYQNLFNRLTDQYKAQLEMLWSGWMNDEKPYHEKFAATKILDADGDGLANYFENSIGSHEHMADSDVDGWSDFSEFIASKDPMNNSSNPGILISDGQFGDWLRLLPSRIKIDPDQQSSGCPKFADIKQYSALIENDSIMVSAVTAEAWQQPPLLKWQAILEFPSLNRQFLLQAIAGQFFVYVFNPSNFETLKIYPASSPLGIKSMEWVFKANDFGIELDLKQEGAVQVRIMTVYQLEKDVFCDDTPWFSPLVSSAQ